jgi:formylglycine-generating enzyme required for sulfatase activity
MIFRTTPRRVPVLAATALVLTAVLLGQLGCRRADTNPPNAATSAAPVSQAVPMFPLTNMVLIRAGSFTRIRQPVSIRHDYWLGRCEVTQAEYATLLGRNPSRFQGDSNRPVERLTYYDAQAFCAVLTARERKAGHLPVGYEYRLPSEAEWEWACRAGTTNRFSFGDDLQAADAFAWTMENAEATTHPVGLKRPNPWGLYDMHGNVWEWCLDWFAPYPEEPAADPIGPPSGKFKVFRGGGWNQEVLFARSANRFMMSPSNGIHFVGFRVALGRSSPASGR